MALKMMQVEGNEMRLVWDLQLDHIWIERGLPRRHVRGKPARISSFLQKMRFLSFLSPALLFQHAVVAADEKKSGADADIKGSVIGIDLGTTYS
jgi:hypothetical protein